MSLNLLKKKVCTCGGRLSIEEKKEGLIIEYYCIVCGTYWTKEDFYTLPDCED